MSANHKTQQSAQQQAQQQRQQQMQREAEYRRAQMYQQAQVEAGRENHSAPGRRIGEGQSSTGSWSRLLSLAIGTTMILVNVYTNINGFGFINPGYVWVGVLLAIIFEAAIFNMLHEGLNGAIGVVLFGMIGTAYGIFANVYGFWMATGGGMVANDVLRFVSWLLVGVVLEVFSAPALLKGLGVRSNGLLDMLTGIR